MYGSSFTGIGRYCMELVLQLSKIDTFNSYVLFFNEPEYSKFKVPNERFSKIFVGAKHYSTSEQIGFLKKIKNAKLDLMHFTHFNAPLLYKEPSIVTIHDLTLSFFPGKKMNRIWHRAAYQMVLRSAVKKASHIIAVSNHTKEDLKKLLHVKDEKISVIHEGISEGVEVIKDQERLKKTAQRYKLPERFLLYTGVWRYHKNLVGLIKAFKLIKSEKNYPGKLVLTGKPDPSYPEIKEAIKNLQLEDEVISTGLVPEDDLVALLNLAEVFVFPSFYEGFGLPPLEAFSCGTPVAASNRSCIPEICGDAAVFFDPENEAEMADKINLILKSPSLRDNLIERGFERIKRFSWKNMAKETLEIYNSFK